MSPAPKAYQLKKAFTSGRRSSTVKINLPMCELHFRSACFNGAAEKLIGKLGIAAAILAGFFVTVLLLARWEGSENGTILNLVALGVLGLGSVLIFWAILSLSLAPFFTAPTFEAARHAVRLMHYWPEHQFVRLEFQDERLADIVLNTY